MLSHISLFNDPRYQECNIGARDRLFRYDHYRGDRLVGTFSGVIDEGGVLDCGYSAPFGGIDWMRRREQVGAIVELLNAGAARAREEGVRNIRIRARPGYFGTNESAVEFALLNMGAQVESCELSLGIDTRSYRTADEYLAALSDSARNMVRQGTRSGLTSAEVESPADWSDCYELLAATKRRRGAVLKVSLDYVLVLRRIFGGRIAMHRVMQGTQLAAAALVYRVTPDCDYVAAWGDDLKHRGDRAMNVMAYHLVREAIGHRIMVIDFGISSVDGVPDDGLIQFKRSIGGTAGLRINFLLPL